MRLIKPLLALLGAVGLAAANKDTVNNKVSQVCSGMYGKSTWGGARTPFILTDLKDFHAEGDANVDVSVIVFEYRDIGLLGSDAGDGNKKYFCDASAVAKNLCTEEQLNLFIFNKDNYGKNQSEVLTHRINSPEDAEKLKYHIAHTGYYCVASHAPNYKAEYKIEINFKNSFGEIAASEFPKIPLYAFLAILYAVCLAFYGWSFYKHRHEILPLQKNFLFFFVFLTLETAMTFSYYDLENSKGAANAGVKVYMVFISIFNSFKFTFSFYLLLIIALGYGVVHPKLERKQLLQCKILAGVHFASAVGYTIVNYLSSPESELNASGFVVLPVMILTIVFYVTILKSLSETTQLLGQQKQVVKLQMYKNLFRIIFFSLFVLILGVFISSFVFVGMSTVELIERHWKSRFFFLEFWPSLVYFMIFIMIAYIWRPTDTSYMLAASSQLPTDPENAADFELDDLQSMVNNQDNDGYNHLGDNDSLDLDNEDNIGDNRVGELDENEDAEPKYAKGKKD